jgi:hypothetical protein
MPADTNARQNAIIWSACGGIILILCGIVGWLINGKDIQLTTSINTLIANQSKFMEKTDESDRKIMESFQKLCDRVGVMEGRITNLEIFIQMPYLQRQKLFETFKYNPPGNGKK